MYVEVSNLMIAETVEQLLNRPHYKVDRILLSLTQSPPDKPIPEIETLSADELQELVEMSTTSPPLSKAFVRLADLLIEQQRLPSLVAAMSREGSDLVSGLTQLVEANRLQAVRSVLELAEREGKLFRFLEGSALKISEKDSKLERSHLHPALHCAVRMGKLDMVNELVSFYRKASKLDAFVRKDVVVPLFDTALVQKTSDIADTLWRIAGELDTKAASCASTKTQLLKRFEDANWNPPEHVEKTVSNWLASTTRILRHAFV